MICAFLLLAFLFSLASAYDVGGQYDVVHMNYAFKDVKAERFCGLEAILKTNPKTKASAQASSRIDLISMSQPIHMCPNCRTK